MFTRFRVGLTLLASVLWLLAGSSLPLQAQTLTTIYSHFDGIPSGLIQSSDGNFYGETQDGGTYGKGSLYRLTPGSVLTILYNFTGGADGYEPYGLMLQAADGSLYGQTYGGGAYNQGTLFKLTSTGTLTTLHAFTPLQQNQTNADGLTVSPPLIQGGDGNIYGATSAGGPNATGVIFRLTPDGAYTVVHAFAKLSGTGTNGDGASPGTGLVQGLDGNLYDVANAGGPGGTGTVFKIALDGTFTLLYAFTPLNNYINADGANPTALALSANGVLTGFTSHGGPKGGGTIFTISPNGTFTILITQAYHETLLPPIAAATDGSFYGQTYTGPCGPECGGSFILEQVSPSGRRKILAVSYLSSPFDTVLQGSNGLVYGVVGVEVGGAMRGVVFKISLASADVNGDGSSDLLWQNQSTGEVVYTLLNGITIRSWGDILQRSDTHWNIVGLGNFSNYIGQPGLVWQNPTTGDVGFTALNDTAPVYPDIGTMMTGINPAFQVVGTPDLNGDGFDDILFQNQAAGDVVYALMHSDFFSPDAPIAWGHLFTHIDPNFRIVGTPDLNGDGNPDILWQNLATGDVVYTLMNGLTPIRWGTLFKGINTNYRIVGTLDLNRDGHPDLLWQNQVTGEVVYTLMQGTTALSWGDLFKSFDTHWKLVGLH